ncbi:hypothetical protein MCHI_003602, partial [Candidatus Magnetoovum chiemensis]
MTYNYDVYLKELIVYFALYYNTDMDTVRLNITLPIEVANSIKHVKNKSAFIAEALKEYVHNKKL